MIKQVFKTMVAFLAVATMTIGPVRGQNASPDVTLDFTTNTWGLPAGKSNITYAANSYTSGGYTITLQGGGSSSNGYYFHNDGYLLLGKSGAYLQLPAFGSPVEKIEVVGNSGASTAVEQNVFVDDNNSWVAVSTSKTGATGTKTYVINENYRAAGNIYTLKVGSAQNTQITYIKVYYVSSGGGSGSETPTPGQNASGENIFQYCYDCQRNPAYPKTTASATLDGFQNPYVGYKGSGPGMGNTSDGPWKLEYVGLWSTTDKHGIEDFIVSIYQSEYNCTDVPVFRLYQWNATANEYQHAAYGVVCAYAKVSNAVEHTAFFEAEGGTGCVLTNSSHSSSMNITFDEDLTTGITTLIPAPAVPHTVRFASGNDGWTVTDVDSARSAVAPAVLQNVIAGDSLVATYNGNRKVKSVKAVKYVAPAATVTTAPTATDAYIEVGSTAALVNAGAANGGTMMYAVTTTNVQPASTADFSATRPTAEGREAGTYYVWYYAKADADHSDSEIAGPVSVPLALTVTWNSSNVSDLNVMGTFLSYTKEGITLSANANQNYAEWMDFGDESMNGIVFNMNESGGYTFTAPTGKQFTKIEMTLNGQGGWNSPSLGTGWAYADDSDPMTMDNIYKVTWKGSAASTVGLLTGANNFSGETVKSIVFTLIDAQ